MSAAGSVTKWIDQLQAGDREVTEKLWERYYRRLVGLARAKLRGTPGLGGNEEDVALSALYSFFRSAEQGKFPGLRDRDNLWRLLFVITERKAFKLLRDQEPCLTDQGSVLDKLSDRKPDPKKASIIREEFLRLLHMLDSPELRLIAVMKMEAFTTKQIARSLDCAPRTIERKVREIRGVWEKDLRP